MTTSEASEQHPHDASEVLAGRYRLGARIGSGSTGIVYRAEDLMYDRQVAVRLLTPALSREDETLARLEARLHRNAHMLRDDVRALSDIVDLIDLGRAEGGQAFVVTELLPGESLAELLVREGPLPWRRLRPLAVRACQIVHLSHEHGVVRQDLQTRNLYPVRGKAELGTLRVYSPGLGVAFGERLWSCLDPAEALQLARYAAPEQISSGGVDRRADVYALGVILYECLTGQVPFADPRPAHVLAAHLLSPPPPFPADARRRGASGELEAIVLRCLAKAPDDRWPTAMALANAMAAIEFGPVDASGAIEAGELNDFTDLLEPAPSATTMRIDRSRLTGRAGLGPVSATELARPVEHASDPAASTSELAWREILDAAESAIGAVVRDQESREGHEPTAASVSTLTRNSVTAPDDLSDSTPTLAYGAETSAARWNPPTPAPRRTVRAWPIAAALALTTATGVAYFVRSSAAPRPAQDAVSKRGAPPPAPADTPPLVVTAPPPAAEPPPTPPSPPQDPLAAAPAASLSAAPQDPPATEPAASPPPALEPAPAPAMGDASPHAVDPTEPVLAVPPQAAAVPPAPAPSPAATPAPASAPPSPRRPRARPPAASAPTTPAEGDAPTPPRKALPAARRDPQEHELPDPAAPAPSP